MSNSTLLRKCQYCELEAHTEAELENFTKDKRYNYGRRNICKPCFAKLLRKGGQYHEGHKKSCDNWLNENQDKHEETMRKRITFKGKRVYLKENPRKGVCSNCGAIISEEQDRQAPMHHEFYDEKNPEAGTFELCDKCHTTFHDIQRKEELKKGNRKGWNKP